MRVTLKEHGGLAAAITRHAPGRTADTGSLPVDVAEELERLVRAALTAAADPPAGPGAADPPAGPGAADPPAGPGAARDAMSYTVTVEDDAGAGIVLTGSDTAASPEFTELVRWLQDHAR